MSLVKALCIGFFLVLFIPQKVFAQESLEDLFITNSFLELPQNSASSPISNYQNLEETTGPIFVKVPILMYHYIEPVKDPNDKVRTLLTTWPQTLDEQVKTLKEAGYNFMTNAELSDVLDGKASLPQKAVLLTFDDGYKDFYEYAYPILRKYNAKATNYVISGLLNNPNHLSDSELVELSADNNIEIGAHTVDHIGLKGANPLEQKYEIQQGKEDLERLIGKTVNSFAYPYGSFDENAALTVKASGFKSAVSTLPGISQSSYNRFIMYRLRPGIKVGQELINFLNEPSF